MRRWHSRSWGGGRYSAPAPGGLSRPCYYLLYVVYVQPLDSSWSQNTRRHSKRKRRFFFFFTQPNDNNLTIESLRGATGAHDPHPFSVTFPSHLTHARNQWRELTLLFFGVPAVATSLCEADREIKEQLNHPCWLPLRLVGYNCQNIKIHPQKKDWQPVNRLWTFYFRYLTFEKKIFTNCCRW